MAKIVSTRLTRSNIARVLEILSDTPGELARLGTKISSAQYRQPLGDGERSFAEDLAHLLNTEARSAEAITLALLADVPLLTNIHPERQYGKLVRYDLLPSAELLDYFNIRRTVLLRVLASLDEDQWSRAVRETGKQRQESVYWRARSLALHELEHLSDLESKIAQSGLD